MTLDFSQRKNAIGAAVCAVLLLALVVACIVLLRIRANLKTEGERLKAELSAVTRVRDAQATALAPYESLAEQQLPSEAAEKRLTLLLGRIKALTTATVALRGRRQLDAEAIARIRAKLTDVPSMQIEIGGVARDAETLALAEELRSIFEGAGLETKKVAQYLPSAAIPPGVAIYSKHELDGVLSEAIAQIFVELGQEPIQWLEEDAESSNKVGGERKPDLKIVIGQQRIQ